MTKTYENKSDILRTIEQLITTSSADKNEYNMDRLRDVIDELLHREDAMTPTVNNDRGHTESLDHTRMQLWCDVAVAVAAAPNSTDKAVPGRWANKVLEAFDENFGTNTKK